MRIHAVIPGNPVTGNHARKTAGFRKVWSPKKRRYAQVPNVYVTEEALDYRSRVGVIVKAAMARVDMQMPEYCRLDIAYYNIRQDRDNVVKELADGLQGIAFPADSRVLDGWIQKRWDDGEPRVEIWLEEINRKEYDARTKARSRNATKRAP